MEQGSGVDRFGVRVDTSPSDSGRGSTIWLVRKWDADQTDWVARRTGITAPLPADFGRLGVDPYEVRETVGNVITTAGWTRLLNLGIASGGLQAYDGTHTRIGVGTGTTPAEAAGDTDLIGAQTTNRYWKLVDSRSVSSNVLTIVATFGSGVAEFAWNEFGIDQGQTSGTGAVVAPLLNHRVGISQGTKASGQTWTATATLTFT